MKLNFVHLRVFYKILVLLSILFVGAGCERSAKQQESVLQPEDYPPPNDYQSPAWSFGDEDRLAWQKPEEVIALLGNLEDKTVADIGAGTGYFSYRIAERAKRVIAIDIDSVALSYIENTKKKLPQEIGTRIETRLAHSNDPNLSNGEADIVLVVNTYTFLQNRIRYFEQLLPKMSPSARLMVIDFKKKKTPIGPPSESKVALGDVENELESAGFELMKSDDRMLDYQYIVLARKKTF